MTNFTNYLLSLTFLLIAFAASAQSGQYDVRFNMNDVDCDINKIFVDIEVRANSSATTFNISDQNYRFSYNRNAVLVGSIAIEQMFLEGFLANSFYDPHTLTGSLDTVVSYNVVLAGGDGVLVTTDWLTVGRISFEILDGNECLELIWHDKDPVNFPPTFIGEKFNTELYSVPEGLYLNTSICPDVICAAALPVELNTFTGVEENCAVKLAWTTLSETNNDYFKIEKSTNGNEFRPVGTVKGNGTTTQISSYSFVDSNPSETNYYRLTQVDFNGDQTISETITIKSDCTPDNAPIAISSIFPNPVVQGPITIQLFSDIQTLNAAIMITDVMGRLVYTENTNIVEGTNKLTFDTDKLSSGTYFVKIKDNEWFSSAQKFIKLTE